MRAGVNARLIKLTDTTDARQEERSRRHTQKWSAAHPSVRACVRAHGLRFVRCASLIPPLAFWLVGRGEERCPPPLAKWSDVRPSVRACVLRCAGYGLGGCALCVADLAEVY
jgi:hypothetical protein